MPDSELETLTVSLLDLACPIGELFYTNIPDNPNTYLPGAANTTWAIYTDKMVRGIPVNQEISTETKGSDISIPAHLHSLNNHYHEVNMIQNISGQPTKTGLSANVKNHVHTIEHVHAGGLHRHSAGEESLSYVTRWFSCIDPLNYAPKQIYYGNEGSIDPCAVAIGYYQLTKYTDVSSPAYLASTNLVTGGFAGDIGFIAAGYTNIGETGPCETEYSGSTGIENGNIPAYKEVYIWQRIT